MRWTTLASVGSATDVTAAVVAVVLALVAAIALVLFAAPAARRFAPAVLPMLAGSLLGLAGHAVRASVLLVLGMTVALLILAGVDIERRIARLAHLAGLVLGALGSAVVFVVAVLPAWVWHLLRRRSSFPGRPAQPSWVDRSTGGQAVLLGGRRGFFSTVAWSLGVVVLVAGLNYGGGWLWDRQTGQASQQTADLADPAPPKASTGPVSADPRADVASMAAYPWRDRYFADVQRTTYSYWPFTESRPEPFRSPYINLNGWERRSFEPPRAKKAQPTLWMFGGSTTWGEGQRDGYTITSWLGRLAAADGLPLDVQNYGQRGWTHYQEMVLYGQLLDSQRDPDLAVFYDGANELTTQSLMNVAVPSHTLAYSYAKKLGTGSIATTFLQSETDVSNDPLGDAWHAYSEHSLVHKVVRWLQPDPAGAAPRQDGSSDDAQLDPNFTGGQDEERGGVYNYNITEQDGKDAGKVYLQGRFLTQALSGKYDVSALYYWQPVSFDGPAQKAARNQLTKPTIDISGALDEHPEVFIDGGHTNEEGARIVAERIWKDLKPEVERWYREH